MVNQIELPHVVFGGRRSMKDWMRYAYDESVNKLNHPSSYKRDLIITFNEDKFMFYGCFPIDVGTETTILSFDSMNPIHD